MTSDYHLIAEDIAGSCTTDTIVIRRSDIFSLCSLQFSDLHRESVCHAVEQEFNLVLPAPGHVICAERKAAVITVLGLGAGQWLIEKSGEVDDNFDSTLRVITGYAAVITLQSDAWARFEVTGAGTGALFERLVALNMSLSAFPPGSCARTSLHHMNCIINHLPRSAGCYHLYCARSYAQSFFKTLCDVLPGPCSGLKI